MELKQRTYFKTYLSFKALERIKYSNSMMDRAITALCEFLHTQFQSIFTSYKTHYDELSFENSF